MQHFCGIDIGASAAKLVLIDENRDMVAKVVRRSGVNYTETADACLAQALAEAGLARDRLRASFSTGYGRHNVPWADGNMTEIACHGRGAHFIFQEPITVIDIGAQDSKVIHLDADGRRVSFKMNRKCAAGTGSFLDEIALRLDLPLEELNGLAEQSTKEVTLGSFCTVFAATEILAKIRAGENVRDIVKGAFRSVVKRIAEMDTIDGALVLTGGVIAYNPYLATLIQESFDCRTLVPPNAQHVGALGAALAAMQNTAKGE
jgi:predicted CoA-substrate-specific enzyme activase